VPVERREGEKRGQRWKENEDGEKAHGTEPIEIEKQAGD
jgi:hypothetical protein